MIINFHNYFNGNKKGSIVFNSWLFITMQSIIKYGKPKGS